jgi:hypothetical protein
MRAAKPHNEETPQIAVHCFRSFYRGKVHYSLTRRGRNTNNLILDDPQHNKTFLHDDGSLVVVTKMSIDRVVRRNTRQGEVFCLRQ